MYTKNNTISIYSQKKLTSLFDRFDSDAPRIENFEIQFTWKKLTHFDGVHLVSLFIRRLNLKASSANH